LGRINLIKSRTTAESLIEKGAADDLFPRFTHEAKFVSPRHASRRGPLSTTSIRIASFLHYSISSTTTTTKNSARRHSIRHRTGASIVRKWLSAAPIIQVQIGSERLTKNDQEFTPPPTITSQSTTHLQHPILERRQKPIQQAPIAIEPSQLIEMTFRGKANMSEYIAQLNSIPSAQDIESSNNFGLDDDLAMFTNTQFFDFDLGQDADLQPGNFDGRVGETTITPSNVDLKPMDFSLQGTLLSLKCRTSSWHSVLFFCRRRSASGISRDAVIASSARRRPRLQISLHAGATGYTESSETIQSSTARAVPGEVLCSKVASLRRVEA
jgi:hypothetical protein